MRKRSLIHLVMVMFLVLFVITLFQGTGSLAVAKEVKWGCYTDLTGPIATTANNMWDGFKAYHEWMKKYDPIPGITIKLIWQDTGYSAPKYLTAFKKFKSKGMALAYNTSSTCSVTLGPLHKKNKIALISSGGYKPAIVPPAYEFASRPPYVNYFAGAAIQFLKEWEEKGAKRKPRLMFITWDNAYGRGPIPEGKPWAKENGFEVLPSQFFTTPRPTDLSIQLSKAKELGADLVYMNSLAGHFSVLLKDAQKMGLQGKVQFCVGSGAGQPELIRLAGSAAEGAWSMNPYPSWPNDSKGYKWVVKEFKRQGKTLKSDDTCAGFGFARIGSEAIRAAAKKVGPENVGKKAIFNALCNMKDLDMWGLMPNISYAPDLRIPFNYFYVLEVKDQKWHDRAYVKVPWFSEK